MYRYYSKFDANNFRKALKDSLNEVNSEVTAFSEIDGRVETVLNEYVPN